MHVVDPCKNCVYVCVIVLAHVRLRACINVQTCVYVCVRTCMCAHAFVGAQECAYVHEGAGTSMNMDVHSYACQCASVCISPCMMCF